MLKSLEKLREYTFIGHGCTELADEIQAEIDKFYLPRPLFEDGEPANFGDMAAQGEYVMGTPINEFIYYWDGCVGVASEADMDSIQLEPGERLKRPPEPDTQEKIDADYHEMKVNLFRAASQCGIDRDGVRRIVNEFDAIWARQRKLDGVE